MHKSHTRPTHHSRSEVHLKYNIQYIATYQTHEGNHIILRSDHKYLSIAVGTLFRLLSDKTQLGVMWEKFDL